MQVVSNVLPIYHTYGLNIAAFHRFFEPELRTGDRIGQSVIVRVLSVFYENTLLTCSS